MTTVYALVRFDVDTGEVCCRQFIWSPGGPVEWLVRFEFCISVPRRAAEAMIRSVSTTRILNAARNRSMLLRGAAARLRPGVDVGRGLRLGRGIRWRLEPGATVVFGDDCVVDDGVTIAATQGSRLVFGPGVFIGHRSTIATRDRVVLGARSFCGELVSVRDHDHDPDLPPSSGVNLVAPVSIGMDCWIGAKATITRGVTVGDRVVVGANAVVTRDLVGDSVAIGIPAKVFRSKRNSTPC